LDVPNRLEKNPAIPPEEGAGAAGGTDWPLLERGVVGGRGAAAATALVADMFLRGDIFLIRMHVMNSYREK
jgi:hypothetical protein